MLLSWAPASYYRVRMNEAVKSVIGKYVIHHLIPVSPAHKQVAVAINETIRLARLEHSGSNTAKDWIIKCIPKRFSDGF